jgi:hypothetical protein
MSLVEIGLWLYFQNDMPVIKREIRHCVRLGKYVVLYIQWSIPKINYMFVIHLNLAKTVTITLKSC